MIPTLEINFENYTKIQSTRFKLEHVGNNVYILASMATYSELAEEQTKWLQTNYLLPQSNYDIEVEKRMQKSNTQISDLRNQISQLTKKNSEPTKNESLEPTNINLSRNINQNQQFLEDYKNETASPIQNTFNSNKSSKKNPKDILERINQDYALKSKKKVAIGSKQVLHNRRNSRSRSRSRENDFFNKKENSQLDSTNPDMLKIKLFEGTTMTIKKRGQNEGDTDKISSQNCCIPSDSQFIGGKNGSLKQWSVRNKESIRDYYQIMNGKISSIIVTNDKKTAFLGDSCGNLSQFEILKMPSNISYIKKVQNYGNLFKDSINAMAATCDNKTLLISSVSGSIKIVSIPEKKFLRTLFIDNTDINQIKILNDCLSFLAVSSAKHLSRYCINTGKQLKDYSSILEGKIEAINIAHNDKFLYVASGKGQLLQIDTTTASILQNYGKTLNLSQITSMVLSSCGTYLFLGDASGKIKQLSLYDQSVNVDMTENSPINFLTITGNDENLFSVDSKNNMRQWKITNDGLSLINQFKSFENFDISSLAN